MSIYNHCGLSILITSNKQPTKYNLKERNCNKRVLTGIYQNVL